MAARNTRKKRQLQKMRNRFRKVSRKVRRFQPDLYPNANSSRIYNLDALQARLQPTAKPRASRRAKPGEPSRRSVRLATKRGVMGLGNIEMTVPRGNQRTAKAAARAAKAAARQAAAAAAAEEEEAFREVNAQIQVEEAAAAAAAAAAPVAAAPVAAPHNAHMNALANMLSETHIGSTTSVVNGKNPFNRNAALSRGVPGYHFSEKDGGRRTRRKRARSRRSRR